MANGNDPYAHYERAAEQLRIINKRFSFSIWIHIVIALLSCACGMFVAAILSSTMFSPDDLNTYHYSEGDIFTIQYSVTLLSGAGFSVLIILFGLTLSALAVVSAAKIKGATIAMIVLYAAAALLFVTGRLPYFWIYLLLFAVGIGNAVLLLRSHSQLKELSALPGYPHFSRRVSESEKPREEVDLSVVSRPAPMDEINAPKDMEPLVLDRSLDHLMVQPENVRKPEIRERVNLEKTPHVNLSKHIPLPREANPFDNLNHNEIPLSVRPPAVDVMSPSMYDGIPEEEKEALPTIEEIRQRYGQS